MSDDVLCSCDVIICCTLLVHPTFHTAHKSFQLVLYPCADRQPMQLHSGVCDVVLQSKAVCELPSSIDDPLQTGEQTVAIVESCQHGHCHDVGGDVTTKQTRTFMSYELRELFAET